MGDYSPQRRPHRSPEHRTVGGVGDPPRRDHTVLDVRSIISSSCSLIDRSARLKLTGNVREPDDNGVPLEVRGHGPSNDSDARSEKTDDASMMETPKHIIR